MKKIELNNEDDEDIDLFIKGRLFSSPIHHCRIDPSLHFKARTMKIIARSKRRRRIARDIIFAGMALSPFISQQLWLSMRSDYFSISRMPQGEIISSMYRLFISSSGTYVLLIGAVGLVSLQLLRSNLWSMPILKKVPFLTRD